SGRHHELLLVVTTRTQRLDEGGGREGRPDRGTYATLLPAARPQAGDGTPPPDQIILSMVHGYRRTGTAIVIDGTSCEILDDAPGAFGYAATHLGAEDEVVWDIRGHGLTQHGPGIYTLNVPDGGRVVLDTTVEARAPGSGDDGGRSDFLRWLLAL